MSVVTYSKSLYVYSSFPCRNSRLPLPLNCEQVHPHLQAKPSLFLHSSHHESAMERIHTGFTGMDPDSN